MKRKPRRKVDSEREEEDNASSCSTPVKDKENLSPATIKGSPSINSHVRFTTLLKDFDQNGKHFIYYLESVALFITFKLTFIVVNTSFQIRVIFTFNSCYVQKGSSGPITSTTWESYSSILQFPDESSSSGQEYEVG